MHIQKLRLTKFRNFDDATVVFSQGTNLILGNNGEGKTNLLEAIHLLGLGRSHRERKDANLIKFGETYYRVEGHFVGNNIKCTIEIGFDGERKIIKINGKESRATQLVGLVGIVISAPDDIEIVKGSPSLRRAFLDVAICQIDRRYLATLQRYHRILAQRNTLLKSLQGKSNSEKQIQTWDDKLTEAGSFVIERRLEYIQRLAPIFEVNLSTILGRQVKASLVYLPKGYSLETKIESALRIELKRMHEIEIARGYTLVGPHCDDLRLDVEGRDLRIFGSEGEQRSAVIALKCAEADLLSAEVRRPPIVLLDDVFAELDETRSKAVGALISRFDQIILTSSRGPQLEKEGINKIVVSDGKVIQYGRDGEGRKYSGSIDSEDGYKCSH